MFNIERTYYSYDCIKEDSDQTSSTQYILTSSEIFDFLALLKEHGVPTHKLTLKVGSVCSVMQNLSIETGLIKNARVVVKELHERFIKVQLLSNSVHPPNDQLCCLPRIIFEFQPKYCSWTVQ